MVTTAATNTAFEEIKNGVWNEAATHRQNMTIFMPMLMGAEEPQWLHQVQVLPGASWPRRGDGVLPLWKHTRKPQRYWRFRLFSLP
jgi:hypothetical protein